MKLLHHIRRLVTCAAGRDSISDAALVWDADRILWVGPLAELPSAYVHAERYDVDGCLVIPGLVDCHTHLAFGGWRSDEFGLRCKGATYQEIAARGGGIASTMAKTRAASEEELYQRCAGFLYEMTALGVTTVECKSGYGLTVEEELKLLRVYRRLQQTMPQMIVATCLGAHIIPLEYKQDRDGYIDLLCKELLPRVAAEKLASFCDVFVEMGAFSTEEAWEILERGNQLGMRPKLHADQLSDGGGGELAASVRAISADHLEYTNAAGIRAMAQAGVIAVSLPLASLYLNKPPLDARKFLAAGVPVAVATDFNPGSAPSYHLPLAMTLACTMNHLSPAEALRGATIVAAQALGLENEVGSLEPGKRADFVLIDVESVDQWLYHFVPNAATAVYVRGERHETGSRSHS
jgi:imidazolonepropionase